MLLNELFTDDVSDEGIDYVPGRELAHITVNGDVYDVKLMKLVRKDYHGVSVSFDFEKSHGDTGKHVAIQVFGKVFAVVRMMIAQEAPDFVAFQSTGKRFRIYNKFFKSIQNKGIVQDAHAGETIIGLNVEPELLSDAPPEGDREALKSEVTELIHSIAKQLGDMQSAVSAGQVTNTAMAENIKKVGLQNMEKFQTQMMATDSDLNNVLNSMDKFGAVLSAQIAKLT